MTGRKLCCASKRAEQEMRRMIGHAGVSHRRTDMQAVKKGLIAASSVAGLLLVLGTGPADAYLIATNFTWNPRRTTAPLVCAGIKPTLSTNDLTIGDWANFDGSNPLDVVEH